MSSFANKKVLVTGATGLIGSNLVDRLMKDNSDVKVTILARNEDKVLNTFADYLNNSNFEYIIQDITEPINSLEKFDYIFHAAGSIAGEAIRNYPVDVINANIQGTINCLEYLKNQTHGRIIIFSSATVYGNCDNQRIVNESDTQLTDSLDNPICAYSQSKRMAETIARAYNTQYNVDVIIARFSYVFGYTKYYPNTAIFNFIQKALNGDDIVLNGINLARRDNIYVEDAVDMLLEAAQYGNSGEAYNLSSNAENDNFAAIDEITELIVNSANKLTNMSAKLVKKPFEDIDRLPGLIMDNAKIKSVSLHKLNITKLSEAIYKTVKNYYDICAKKGENAYDKIYR